MNHNEKKERRRAVATDIHNGVPISEVCAKHNVSRQMVYSACIEFEVSCGAYMGHDSRKERRQAMAEMATNPDVKLEDICEKFKVCPSTVLAACKEFGVDRPKKPSKTKSSSFAVLRCLVNGDDRSDIEKRFGVSRQWISYVAQQAKAAGWELPGGSNGEAMRP